MTTLSNRAKNLKRPYPSSRGQNEIDAGPGHPCNQLWCWRARFRHSREHQTSSGSSNAEGFTKYTAVGGIDELKDAVIHKFQRDNGLTYKRSQILVSCGGKHSFYNLAQALFDKGDEVIVPSPYWVSYPPMVALAEATPVILETQEEKGFKIRTEDLKRVLTPKTKALILNSPNNPAGSAYTKRELEQIADLALSHPFIVISDEIYEKIVYDDFEFVSIASWGKRSRRGP